jgi:hypothetical protein
MTDEPDRLPDPAAVMANRAALLQNLGNIFPISEVDRDNIIKLQDRLYVGTLSGDQLP